MTLGVGPWGMAAATPRTLRDKGSAGQNPYQLEHNDLMASIRGTRTLSLRGRLRGHEQPDGRHGADGNLFRKARDLGRRDPFSELHLAPDRYAMDARPPAVPGRPGQLSRGDSRHNPRMVTKKWKHPLTCR